MNKVIVFLMNSSFTYRMEENERVECPKLFFLAREKIAAKQNCVCVCKIAISVVNDAFLC